MTTLSQLVDDIVSQTLRVDEVPVVTAAINQSLRECFSNASNAPVFFDAARVEESITTVGETGFVWPFPRPYQVQAVEAVRFDDVFDDCGNPVYAKFVRPGFALNQHTEFFYRTGDSLAFAGYGGDAKTISVSLFEYVPVLKYYAVGARPASFDAETGFTYLPAFDVDATTRANAQALTTNWMLLRWPQIIEEGAKAKLYKAKDDPRQRAAFSLYEKLRKSLFFAEALNFAGTQA